MNLVRKIISIPIIVTAVMSIFSLLIAIIKNEKIEVIFGILFFIILFSLVGYLIYPKKSKIYRKNRSLPELNKNLQESIKIPEKDNQETDFVTVVDKEIPVNLLCFLHYKDVNGQESKRRILIKKIVPWNKDNAILAYCYERNAHRTFLVSRIITLCDLETGEVIENPQKYFSDRFYSSPLGIFTDVIKIHETEILVLCFIARVDGRMVKSERKIISDYINSKSESFIDENVLDLEIKNIYCELKDFNKHIKKLKYLPEDEKKIFINTIDKLILADNKNDPMEKAAREKIISIINRI